MHRKTWTKLHDAVEPWMAFRGQTVVGPRAGVGPDEVIVTLEYLDGVRFPGLDS